MSRQHWVVWTLIREGFEAFVDDNALSRGAAIAFYAVTAIAPVLFIATAIAALGLGQDAASGAVHYQLARIMSSESADLVQMAILHVRGGTHTLASSLIGIAALVITASGFFTEIEDALNVIWKAPRKESYLYQIVRGRILSLGLVISLGFLLMIGMTLIADAFQFHVPRGYVYAAMGFSTLVEVLNLLARRARRKKDGSGQTLH